MSSVPPRGDKSEIHFSTATSSAFDKKRSKKEVDEWFQATNAIGESAETADANILSIVVFNHRIRSPSPIEPLTSPSTAIILFLEEIGSVALHGEIEDKIFESIT